MKYKIVSAGCGVNNLPTVAFDKLKLEVNKLIDRGWQPQGEISMITRPLYLASQAMIHKPAPKPPGKA
jgi:hypothetical protein